jgi:hypothetical protein
MYLPVHVGPDGLPEDLVAQQLPEHVQPAGPAGVLGGREGEREGKQEETEGSEKHKLDRC